MVIHESSLSWLSSTYLLFFFACHVCHMLSSVKKHFKKFISMVFFFFLIYDVNTLWKHAHKSTCIDHRLNPPTLSKPFFFFKRKKMNVFKIFNMTIIIFLPINLYHKSVAVGMNKTQNHEYSLSIIVVLITLIWLFYLAICFSITSCSLPYHEYCNWLDLKMIFFFWHHFQKCSSVWSLAE